MQIRFILDKILHIYTGCIKAKEKLKIDIVKVPVTYLIKKTIVLVSKHLHKAVTLVDMMKKKLLKLREKYKSFKDEQGNEKTSQYALLST